MNDMVTLMLDGDYEYAYKKDGEDDEAYMDRMEAFRSKLEAEASDEDKRLAAEVLQVLAAQA